MAFIWFSVPSPGAFKWLKYPPPNYFWLKSAYGFECAHWLASAVLGTSPVIQICYDGCCTCSTSIFSCASEDGVFWTWVLVLEKRGGLVYSQKGDQQEHLTLRRARMAYSVGTHHHREINNLMDSAPPPLTETQSFFPRKAEDSRNCVPHTQSSTKSTVSCF